MESKKTTKGNGTESIEKSDKQDTLKFEDRIFQISQKLIKNYSKKGDSKNEEKYAKLIEDLTKKDFQQLSKQYNDEKQKNEDLTDTLKRLQAEFENYKKRIEKEKGEFIIFSKAELIAKLLPILDSFELALKNSENKEKFVKGVEIIFAQLHSLLESEGLKPIEAKGIFDPYKHDVLMKEKSDKEDDTILEELQKGYMLNDKVLRHAKVKVSEKDARTKFGANEVGKKSESK